MIGPLTGGQNFNKFDFDNISDCQIPGKLFLLFSSKAIFILLSLNSVLCFNFDNAVLS
jgi:hypothetical protein